MKQNEIKPLSRQLDFVVLDIETTGLEQQTDEIIEIAAIRFEKGEIKEKYNTFIKPTRPVPAFIKKLTNITDEMLAKGKNELAALKELKNFCQNHILLCHNTRFDIEFINTRLHLQNEMPLHNIMYDTLPLSQIFLTTTENHKLETMVSYFGLELEGAHRAINDAEATGYLFLKLLDFIERNIDLATTELLYRMSGRTEEYSHLEHLLNKMVNQQKITALLPKPAPEYDIPDMTYIDSSIEKPVLQSLPEVFGEAGSLAAIFDDYEFRNGQLEMAESIAQAFEDKIHLLVEAGTGVGKSLAYLVPAVQFSITHSEKVIISTNTKNLQEQLFTKDLPLIKQCLQVPFKAVLLKGRSNYICEKKWQELLHSWERTAASWEISDLMRLVVWKKFTKTGDIVENNSFNTGRMSSTWKKVVSDRHFCQGKRCRYGKSCYLMNKRELAETANIVIINHHLLLADATMENSSLGEFGRLIIDEAHNLPNVAHSELGFSLSWPDIQNFFLFLFTIRKEYQSGAIAGLKSDLQKSMLPQTKKDMLANELENLINLIEECREQFPQFFWDISETVNKYTKFGKLSFYTDAADYGKFAQVPDLSFMHQVMPMQEKLHQLSEQGALLENNLKLVEGSHLANYDTHLEMASRMQNRIQEIYKQLGDFSQPDYDAYAYWFSRISISDTDYPAGVLNVVPLDIGAQMAEYFYNSKDSIIFTSATLAIRGRFKYYERGMGLDLANEAKVRVQIVSSPFDYARQSVVLNTSYLPKYSDTFFFPQAVKFIAESCQMVPGGTLVLFTSYNDMDAVYKKLAEELPQDVKLLVQSRSTSRTNLLNQFRDHGKGVLLGTASFWEGVDVPGDALAQIIIYKLPFPSPGDPVVEAIIKKLERENKNSFEYYTLPEALLKYRQGYGRLIRSKTDTGVIIVLDNRISRLHDRYGKYFIETLPAPTIICRNPQETSSRITAWFREKQRY
ncbi:MAG: DEAD/DEAH box helicase [Candidatus Cloacimonetes bacterium]|nr:DEAD/DEAH box helicase [Candidatus Cloacimonadota bacterium]